MGGTGNWRTSSHSAACGDCVEVGNWRKSSRCASGECVEVGAGGTTIGVRDSKDPAGPVLTFSAGAWERFTAALTAAGHSPYPT
jgi:Domain of unknown function (DUF397)